MWGDEPARERSYLDGNVYLIADDPALRAALARVRRTDEQVHEGLIPYLRHDLQSLKTARHLGLQLRSRSAGRAGVTDYAEPVLPQQVWARYEALWTPAIVFLDLAVAEPSLPERIHDIRGVLPTSLFVLHGTESELTAAKRRLGREWTERLRHYYVLRKPSACSVFRRRAQDERTLRTLLDRVRPIAQARVRTGLDKAPRLFVSYSHRDALIAEELEYRLHFAGYQVWMDVQSIDAGDAWSDAINRGLEQSELLILVVSPEALRSAYVQREYAYFLDSGKPLIPILTSDEAELPERLASIQTIDFRRGDFELNFRRLLAGIANYLPLPE